MKIALLTDSFTVGGGLEYIYQVARGLPQHQFVVCARGGPDAQRLAALANVTLDDTGYGPSTVARHGVDLIHINHARPLVAHCLISRPLRPVINTVHGIHLRRYDFIPGMRSRITAAVRTRVERRCQRHVNLNIALTASDRSYLTGRLGAQRVEVIPNGVDLNCVKGTLSPENALPSGIPCLRFLTVARFDFQKGYDLLLTAIAAIQKQARGAHFHFDFVGDGGLRRSMEQRAQASGIADLVHFMGQRFDVEARLDDADCVVLPSRWEGLPFILLEAGRSGRDVICSDASGNRDVADGGRCATLFRNEDTADLAAKLLAYGKGQGRGLGRVLQAEVRSKYDRATLLQRLDALYQEFQT